MNSALYDMWKSAEMEHAPHTPLKNHIKDLVLRSLRPSYHANKQQTKLQEALATNSNLPFSASNSSLPLPKPGQAQQGEAGKGYTHIGDLVSLNRDDARASGGVASARGGLGAAGCGFVAGEGTAELVDLYVHTYVRM